MSDSEPESSTGDSDSLNSTSKVYTKCRICLTENGKQNVCVPWPEPWKGMGPTIACDIFKLTKIIIFKRNSYKFICSDCCTTLKLVCKFVNTMRMSDLILKKVYRNRILKKINCISQENEQQITNCLSGDEDHIQVAKIMVIESSQNRESDDGDDDNSDEFEDDLFKAYSEITKQDKRQLNKQVDQQKKEPKQNICTQEQQKFNENKEKQQMKKKEFNLNKQPKLNMCTQDQHAVRNICTQERQTELNICIPQHQPEQNMSIPEQQAEKNMCIPEQQPEPNMCKPEQLLGPNMCITEQDMCGKEQPIPIKQERDEQQEEQSQNTKEFPQPIQLDKSVSNIIFDSTIEVKQEVLSEDEYNMPVEESDHLVAVKSEPSDYLEGNIQIVNCNGSVPFSSPEKDSDREIFMREVGLERVIKLEPMSSEACYLEEEYLDSSIKEEPWSEEEETDLSLDCQLCAKELSCLSGLKAHVIAQHSYKSVGVKKSVSRQPKPSKFTCLICGKAFSTKTDQMVHSIGHAACVCFGCGRGFSSFSELARHRPACRSLTDAHTRPQYPRLINANDCTKKNKTKKYEKKHDITKDVDKKDESEGNINKESGRDEKEDKKPEGIKKDCKDTVGIKDEYKETAQNIDEKRDSINNDSENQENIKKIDVKQENIQNYVEIEINIKKDYDTEKIEREKEQETKINDMREEDTKRDDEEENITTVIKINNGDKKYDVHVEIIQESSDEETLNEKGNKKRQSGEQIKSNGEAKRPKHQEPSCPESCIFKCTQNFTTAERQAIRSRFTSLRRQAKWEFFLEHTVRRNIKNKQKSKDDSRRRRRRYEYYFNKNDVRFRVCKIFFCNVLRIGSVTIPELYRKCDSGRVTFDELNTKKLEILENPSLRLSCKKISQVEKHIQSVSTYNRTDELNVDLMYAMYANATVKPVGKEIYERVYEILIKTAFEKFETDNKSRRKSQPDETKTDETKVREVSESVTDGVMNSDSIKVENDSEVRVKEEVVSSDEGSHS